MHAYLLAVVCLSQLDAALLPKLPMVAKVETPVVVDKPAAYLIHVLDWHFVPEVDFLADLRDQGIREDLDAKYAKHLDDVEAVQSEQKALLLALAEHYGITEVYIEGLTKEDVPEFNARLTKLRGLGAKMEAFAKLAAESNDAELKELVATSRDAHRRQMLLIGAAGQLHMEGKLKALPADDKKAHDAARPVGDDGKVRLDAKLIEAREAAIVKNVTAGGPVSVLILGGAHDLSDNVPDGCQYIRVGTKAYQKMAGGR